MSGRCGCYFFFKTCTSGSASCINLRFESVTEPMTLSCFSFFSCDRIGHTSLVGVVRVVFTVKVSSDSRNGMALASDLASMAGQVKSRNLGNAFANLSRVGLSEVTCRVSRLCNFWIRFKPSSLNVPIVKLRSCSMLPKSSRSSTLVEILNQANASLRSSPAMENALWQ